MAVFFIKLETLMRLQYGSACWESATIERVVERSVQLRMTGAEKQHCDVGSHR
jgi:hypothetical protein